MEVEEEEESSYKEIEEAYKQYIRGWNTNTTSNKSRRTRRMEVQGGGRGGWR
jgi:hypothetical protein